VEEAMPAYVVVKIMVRNRETYEQYKQLAAPTVAAAFGGRYLVRGGSSETLEGGWKPSRFVLLEFPDAAAGRAWWASSEYGPAKALRQAAADTDMVLVEGVPG
jgi:uncharacterized protein (DUF1330 family)